MGDLYHESIYDPTAPIGSFWEETAGEPVAGCDPLDGDASCDVAVIGAGYTGLSAALHLARDSDLEVRVFDAGPPGWGASGRNGGFCGLGGTKLSLDGLLRRYGEDETRRYYAAGVEAVELVRDLAMTEGFDADFQEDGELCVAHRPNRLAELREEAEAATKLTGLRHEIWSREELAERAYSGPEAHGALFIPVGFGVHPLKLVRGLARAALRHGAKIHAMTPVLSWTREGGRQRLTTPRGTVTAGRVVIATNGFTRARLAPDLEPCLLPALSNIVTTRPLSDEERAAQGWSTGRIIYDSRRLLFYFRMLPDGRFLFGARGGLDASPEGARRMRAWMVRRLGEMFPAWRGIEITHFWRGLICLSRRLVPHVGPLDRDGDVWCALAYHGSGVALATWAGRAVACAMRGGAAREIIPLAMTERPTPFPLPAFRRAYLRAAYWGYTVLDERL